MSKQQRGRRPQNFQGRELPTCEAERRRLRSGYSRRDTNERATNMTRLNMKLWHSQLVIPGFFFFFLISAGRICSRNAENIILVPYLPTQIKTLIYLRKPEEMKLCCPKQICPPHTGGNISLCCSSRGAHENTFQVTPLTQAMLSTFHYYSPQVDRFTDKNVPICLYLLMLATHRKAWATKILCFYNIE